MSQKIKPLNVSPIIRGSRYILLFSGIMYGSMKRSALRIYESTAKPKREQRLREEFLREHNENLAKTRIEMKNLVNLLEIPDVPDGWEQSIE